MSVAVLQVDGVDVHIDGDGAHTIVMVHGWPDTWRLWDAQVAPILAASGGQDRIARFSWPGFDLAQPPRPMPLQGLVDLLERIIDTLSPGQPVTLVLHDWGCVFGYEYLAQQPQRVSRLVAVDIGDHNSAVLLRSLPGKAKLMVAGYQLWLALAWGVGRWVSRALANRMTRSMARAMRCPVPPAQMGWQMNYPYADQWTGGYRLAAQVAPVCPTLYVWGKRKPFQFQSQRWVQQQAARPGCVVQAFDAGHWVMLDQPAAFSACVTEWLARTPVK
jgi:pimeloyl-ACP methyl ester carboxylesterase